MVHFIGLGKFQIGFTLVPSHSALSLSHPEFPDGTIHSDDDDTQTKTVNVFGEPIIFFARFVPTTRSRRITSRFV